MHPQIPEMECDPLALRAQLGTFMHCANVVDLAGVSVPTGGYVIGTTGMELPFGITSAGQGVGIGCCDCKRESPRKTQKRQ